MPETCRVIYSNRSIVASSVYLSSISFMMHGHTYIKQLYILYCCRYATCSGPSPHSMSSCCVPNNQHTVTSPSNTTVYSILLSVCYMFRPFAPPSPFSITSIAKTVTTTHTAVLRHSYRPFTAVYISPCLQLHRQLFL
jgi:hypothetical protein